MATVQHALLRGIEAVFQLEEGEMLAEPMPTRDLRNGFLLYEATEGGAGVLTRLASQEDGLALVARTALQIMHFRVSEDHVPESPAGLADDAETACVAACYRCLMSYYNQPDHEILDRRDGDARTLLLRLAHSRTVADDEQRGAELRAVNGGQPDESRWLSEASRRGIPEPDPKPLAADGWSVPWVWREHYVAAVFGEAEAPALQAMEEFGFEVVRFGAPESWNAAFVRLTSALGQAP